MVIVSRLLLCLIPSLVSKTEAPAQVTPGEHFVIYNALLYKNTPDLSTYGLHKIFVFYEGDLLDNDVVDPPDLSKRIISLPKIDRLAEKAKKEASIPVCLDIESWGLDHANRDRSLPKYLHVLREFKRFNCISKAGYYEVFPHDSPHKEYWVSSPIRKSVIMKDWNESNDFVKEVGEEEDIAYPAFYTEYRDTATWSQVVREKVDKIRKIGKRIRIYGFLWPQYYTNDGHYDFIEPGIWRYELETLYRYCDGIVIWSHYIGPDGKAIDFALDMSWFKVTQEFVRVHNLK